MPPRDWVSCPQGIIHTLSTFQVAKTPRGPTLTLKVAEYSLIRDVQVCDGHRGHRQRVHLQRGHRQRGHCQRGHLQRVAIILSFHLEASSHPILTPISPSPLPLAVFSPAAAGPPIPYPLSPIPFSQSSLQRPRVPQNSFKTAPLVVMNNFGQEEHMKLATTMFQVGPMHQGSHEMLGGLNGWIKCGTRLTGLAIR